MGTIGVRPGQGTFGIPHARILAPGDPYRSVLFYRMALAGPGRGDGLDRGHTAAVDRVAVALEGGKCIIRASPRLIPHSQFRIPLTA